MVGLAVAMAREVGCKLWLATRLGLALGIVQGAMQGRIIFANGTLFCVTIIITFVPISIDIFSQT
jgi:hypothetical protein